MVASSGLLMVDILSHPLPPLGLNANRATNGQIAQAEVGAVIATTIRHLAGQERKPPTARAGALNQALTLVQSASVTFQFLTKHYLRDVYIKFLAGGVRGVQDDIRSYAVRLDIDGTLSDSRTLNFVVLGGETVQQVPWVSTLFTDVGPNPGEAENGNRVAEIQITADPNFDTKLWAIDVVQLHTPVLEQ